MSTLHHLVPRDPSDATDQDHQFGPPMGNLLFVFFALLLVACSCSLVLLYLRRSRRAQEQKDLLPTHHRSGHYRSLTIATTPKNARGESVFVYDEKMNLIANSSSPPDSPVPEIRVTFPDEEDKSGEIKAGRVVVVHITDSGSVGMEPLHHDPLPPYQKSDADRFQSLDLERIGGLREKGPASQRWS